MSTRSWSMIIYTKTRRSPNSRVNESMKIFHTERRASVGRKTIKRRPGKRRLDGKDFLLADEIDYIRNRAAEYNGRLVTVGPLVLFSTERRCMAARSRRPPRRPPGAGRRSRGCLFRGDRHQLCNRLEGQLPD